MDTNLIDMTEEFASQMDMNFCRVSDNEITLQLRDTSPDYTVTAVLKQEDDIAYFLCDMNLIVTEKRYQHLAKAITQANEHTVCGYFNVVSSNNHIVYNLTIPFVSSISVDEDLIESTMRLITNECDKFYQYFLVFTKAKVAKGCVTNPLLLNTVLLDTIGEA